MWVMDTETYATFTDLYDRMASPKLGGVRFIDSENARRAEAIENDDRTPRQLASDGFLHLLTAGADTDDTVLLGSGAPIIRITVAETALRTGNGLARIDGQAAPVSIATAQRLLCGGGDIRIGFDQHGDATGPRIRIADLHEKTTRGACRQIRSCMHPDCDRPPSWCEAHHILHWARDRGKTVIETGILLCKFHHLKYHNEGYEIGRDQQGQYWLTPPVSRDPEQRPIVMPLKTRNLDDLRGLSGSRDRAAG